MVTETTRANATIDCGGAIGSGPVPQVKHAPVGTGQPKAQANGPQSRETGLTAPAAVILWASVSEEVDQRLTATIDQPLRLKPHEWKSGDILWIVAAAGEPRAVMAVLEQQRQAGFKGRQIKFRVVDERGARAETIASGVAIQAPEASR